MALSWPHPPPPYLYPHFLGENHLSISASCFYLGTTCMPFALPGIFFLWLISSNTSGLSLHVTMSMRPTQALLPTWIVSIAMPTLCQLSGTSYFSICHCFCLFSVWSLPRLWIAWGQRLGFTSHPGTQCLFQGSANSVLSVNICKGNEIIEGILRKLSLSVQYFLRNFKKIKVLLGIITALGRIHFRGSLTVQTIFGLYILSHEFKEEKRFQ